MSRLEENLSRLCVGPDASIRTALKAIDDGGIGLAVVTDPRGRVVGVLSDGDVRRALLAGHGLDDPVAPHMTRSYLSVRPDATRAEILDMMRARVVQQIPVLADDGRLVGIHTMREVLGAAEKPNWAVIMAGGQGTRLRPITEKIPKPMIPVAGRPILERLVLHLVGYGIRTIYLAVNYMAEVIADYFGDGSAHGCHIRYLRETEAMGSGGALSLLPEVPADPVLCLNGDLLTQVDIEAMLAFHSETPCYATMGVRPFLQKFAFGCVEADGQGFIRSIEEKPTFERWINAGVYVLSPKAVADVPRRFFPMTDLFVDALRRSEPCRAFVVRDDWIDIGRHEQLAEARGERRHDAD